MIYKKDKDGEELTKKYLEFLYELNGKIKRFGYKKYPIIEELKEKRDKR